MEKAWLGLNEKEDKLREGKGKIGKGREVCAWEKELDWVGSTKKGKVGKEVEG